MSLSLASHAFLVLFSGMISLGGGMPNPDTFPFEAITIQLKSGTSLKLKGPSLENALQYSPTPGLPPLVQTLTAMMEKEHKPPPIPDKRALSITTGSQYGLYKAFEMLVGSEDAVLIEKPTYSGTLSHLFAVNSPLVCIDTDEEGIVPEHLSQVLRNWSDPRTKPKVLYTIPTGSNPTGVSMSFKRKQSVYAIAVEHNLILLEDDPYYYLTLHGQERSKVR
jgi:kynurenine/2-aminoadipate aminotransferase